MYSKLHQTFCPISITQFLTVVRKVINLSLNDSILKTIAYFKKAHTHTKKEKKKMRSTLN